MDKREVDFCDNYIANYFKNAHKAARDAGFPERKAYHAKDWIRPHNGVNDKNPLFRQDLYDYIESARSALTYGDKTASPDELINFFTSVIRSAVPTNLPGQKPTTTKASLNMRLRAAEDLARIQGLFKDNVSVDASGVIIIDDIGND